LGSGAGEASEAGDPAACIEEPHNHTVEVGRHQDIPSALEVLGSMELDWGEEGAVGHGKFK